jgi:hypothetical protein
MGGPGQLHAAEQQTSVLLLLRLPHTTSITREGCRMGAIHMHASVNLQVTVGKCCKPAIAQGKVL